MTEGAREVEDHCRVAGVEGLGVVIAAANCSLRMGGEAALPFHYFQFLRAAGVNVHLVAHDRNREELRGEFPESHDHIHFVKDDLIQKLLWASGTRLPNRFGRATVGLFGLLLVQAKQRRLIRDLVRDRGLSVVHQPYPVSPAEPSMIYKVGAPVVIGPMNGGIDYPEGFLAREGIWERLAVYLGRRLRHVANRLVPGKIQARVLLVANDRTRAVLPAGIRGEVMELTENGVDPSLWVPREDQIEDEPVGRITRFVFLGRMVEWKGIDLLLRAWVSAPPEATLEIIGDGPMLGPMKGLAERLGLSGSVEFVGRLPQNECAARLRRSDALILPSLVECGGAVVLEAMATGLPVIASDWGGPADYLDHTCGILVPPTSEDAFIAELARSIQRLAESPELRRAMGRAGIRLAADYRWDKKILKILDIYRCVIQPSVSTSERDPGVETPRDLRGVSPCGDRR